MKRLSILLLLTTPILAATTRNDDTCDIGLFPAATLLLPYFEVDVESRANAGESTIFTVTNTAPTPQAARVTLWTDYAYPVISFNLYLTGYDVQKINLYDIIVNGRIAPDTQMGSGKSPLGALSDETSPALDEESCRELPQNLPSALLQRLQSAFRLGRVGAIGAIAACNTVGGVHQNAVGYATIDVVAACTGSLPTDAHYFTHEIRFDNVLIGDYVQIHAGQDYAQGNPMVHIRAVPEGGHVSSRRKSNLPRTFYSNLQHTAANRTLDARQPLPATFATRWIEGGAAGFETFYKIWRESAAGPKTECSAYPASAALPFVEAVRFDEQENPETSYAEVITTPLPDNRLLPSSALVSSRRDELFPPNTSGSVGGWLYINLHNATDAHTASQSWMTASMRAERRFSVDLDAVSLGNGCTPALASSSAQPRPPATAVPIGPAPNVNP